MTVGFLNSMYADVVASQHQCAPSLEGLSKPAIARSSVLRLRGLPFLATTLDVKDFFSGFELSDVYICRRNGRSTGEAYVVLHTPEAAQSALLQLNKKYMANRYIELFEAAKADLAAVKKVLEDSRLQGFVVRLRGLPYSATPADISAFLEGVQLADVEDAIVVAQSVEGRPTGEAYVELADEQAMSLAMTRHKELVGNRYIEVFNSSKVDKLMALQHARFHLNSQPRSRWMPCGTGGAMGGNILQQHMLGMPSATTSYMSGPGMADQLAEALNATHLSVSSPQCSTAAVTSCMGSACMMPCYSGCSGVMPVSPANSAEAAAVAAGQRFLASPGASSASSAAEFRMQQQHVVAMTTDLGQAATLPMAAAGPQYQMMPPGPVMVGSDVQTVYYMVPSQGGWSGQPRVMSLVSASGADAASVMPGTTTMPSTAVQPMMMPGDGTVSYMQPGMASMMLAPAGMQQYAAPPYQWSPSPNVTMRAMQASGTSAGYIYSQPGP